ncbi:hypothetical protein BU202_07260 [Streptococcus cuniculi]|uniref:Uncharacterized protein n=1 Tax=Streptococcus cuniculi TaxID=1432788 RepID=A0A1Q8E6N4_9STRE|nr:hypothetical protein [Streptococcus cuniculi]OLF47451.1 hypothetical protein BU202_07260 [Streptococcus cuniculi]
MLFKEHKLNATYRAYIDEHLFLARNVKREHYYYNPDSYAKQEFKLQKEKDIFDKQRELKSGIIGVTTIDDIEIKDISQHLIERIIERSGTSETILSALKNPLEMTYTKYDENGRSSKQYRGAVTTVAVNPEIGKYRFD